MVVGVHSLVDQIGLFLAIDLDPIWRFRLPMRGEDHNGLGPDIRGDLLSDLLQLRIDGVINVVHDIWLHPKK